jgi:hypothetical protein
MNLFKSLKVTFAFKMLMDPKMAINDHPAQVLELVNQILRMILEVLLSPMACDVYPLYSRHLHLQFHYSTSQSLYWHVFFPQEFP